MRIHEYIEKATAYIADPEKALEVRRELQAHLDEAITEAMGQGLDATSAELVAVGRMGAPEALAVELAAAHHNHLPWRHYLAPFAVLAFLFLDRYAPYMGNQYLYFCTGAMLTICVVPRPATVKRWVRFLSIDLVAKSQWVQRQPLRAAVVSGGASGLAAGLLFGALPAIGQFVYSSGWYDLFVPTALWPVLSRLSWLILFAPLLPWLLGLAIARRRVKADPVVTGVISALAFPLGSLPGLLWLWGGAAPFFWFASTVYFAFAVVAVGWITRTLSRVFPTLR
ncbi:MAG TPA: permease prefix domain 1-containing protein [Symbiobacteriaceae bacterium]|nr:permease prefix domain 1-containing protein [Symbiobacteriaceae bacterium]